MGHVEACGGYTRKLKLVCYIAKFVILVFIISRFDCKYNCDPFSKIRGVQRFLYYSVLFILHSVLWSDDLDYIPLTYSISAQSFYGPNKNQE